MDTSNDMGIRAKHRKLIIAILITGGIASAVSLALLFGVSNSHVLVPDLPVAVSFGTSNTAPLFVLDKQTHSFEALTIDVGNGTLLNAVSTTEGEEGTRYFLLGDSSKELTNTNLYKKSIGGQVTQLTNTNSLKTNLSYDPESKVFSYEVDQQVILFRELDKKETVLVKGSNPVLISGGTRVVFQQGDMLVQSTLAAPAKISTLIPLPKDALYSIDPRSGSVVVYNRATNKIDYFKSMYGTSLSYEKSDVLPQNTQLFKYSNGSLITVVSKDVKGGSFLRVSNSEGAESLVFPRPDMGAPHQLYTYE